MKTVKTLILSGILTLGSSFCLAQTDDDIYYSPKDKPAVKNEKASAPAPAPSSPSKSTEYAEEEKSSKESNKRSGNKSSFDRDDYYDYAYAARIRRFHRSCGLSYYDPYYTNMYYYDYNPYNWGVSIYYGYNWWRPYFYPGFGVSVSYGYGFYDPWGFNPWYSPWYGYGYGNYTNGYYHGFYDGYQSSNFGGRSSGRTVHYGPRGSVSSNVAGYNRSAIGSSSSRLENRSAVPMVVPNRIETPRSSAPVYRSRSEMNSQPVSGSESSPSRNQGDRPSYNNRSDGDYNRPRNTDGGRPSYENRGNQSAPVYSSPSQSAPSQSAPAPSNNSGGNRGRSNSGGPAYRPR